MRRRSSRRSRATPDPTGAPACRGLVGTLEQADPGARRHPAVRVLEVEERLMNRNLRSRTAAAVAAAAMGLALIAITGPPASAGGDHGGHDDDVDSLFVQHLQEVAGVVGGNRSCTRLGEPVVVDVHPRAVHVGERDELAGVRVLDRDGVDVPLRPRARADHRVPPASHPRGGAPTSAPRKRGRNRSSRSGHPHPAQGPASRPWHPVPWDCKPQPQAAARPAVSDAG